MIISENPTTYVSLPSVPEEENVATLRSVTYRPRGVVVPLLSEAFEDCGCWTRERSGTATSLHLRFEVPLHAVTELYSSLVECGLEFDRHGHAELVLLCTLRRHAIVPSALRRLLLVRLELTFADELGNEGPAILGIVGAVA
ncbi:MAG: hypothetical protein ACRYFU_14520 [Janthinobacterium lividum]